MNQEPREQAPVEKRHGYGNIYTPNAGVMIISVQRQSSLANRTIVLTSRQVRLLRIGLYTAACLLTLGAGSWLYFATQAARVPFLTKRLANLQHNAARIDTLQAALSALEGRFQQVQHMLGASPTTTPTADSSAANTHVAVAVVAATARTERDSTLGIPDSWPLPVAGELIPHDSGTARGIDLKVDVGTMVRAAGAGIVVEIRDDSQLGKIVRLSHRDGYESIYGTAGDVRVAQGERVPAGATIALIGNPASGLPPHLHFEVRRGGVDIDPSSLMKKGPSHGDLQ